MRYFFDLSYDGRDFHGWQKQPNALGIQEVVEEKLAVLTRRERRVIAAGRTDTGVHAEHMIAHVDFDSPVNPQDLTYKLNRMLPKSIAVNSIFQVHPEAHARFDASSREYEYRIIQKKNPFLSPYATLVKRPLSVDKMQEAANLMMKHRDFKCFSKSRTDVNTYFCQIEEANWIEHEELLVFQIKADRFLRNMVRAVVGTLIEVGLGKKNLDDFNAVLNSRDRGKAGKSMDAKGLFLKKVTYPEAIRQI